MRRYIKVWLVIIVLVDLLVFGLLTSTGGSFIKSNIEYKKIYPCVDTYLETIYDEKTGEYWLEPSALEVLSGNLKEADMICFSGRRFFESEGRFLPSDQFVRKHYFSGMDYYNDNALQHRDFAFVCVVLRLYRRSFLVDNNLRFKEGILHEDDLFTPKVCFFAQGVSVIDECLYNYRVRANSITTTRSLKRVVDLMSTANELAAFFTSRGGFDETVAYRSITHHYQVVFSEVAAEEKKKIRKMCDWRLYWKVSRTKLRHRVNYLKNRLGR